ncbi:hypothetical protein BZM26_24310 [Paraburkholderia strydomiana]|nr:hypothetical protein BZM26_24310 [Paraburkholderia strydomiana]
MQSTPRTKLLQIQQVRSVGEHVKEFELVCPDGEALQEYEPGAHIELHLPEIGQRHYSLVRPWTPQGAYVIAVQRESLGRGGSIWVHANLLSGSVIEAGQPRNQFRISPDASHHVFIAGGIGLTPLLCMARDLLSKEGSFELIVCAREENRLIYASDLLAPGLSQHVRFVLDEGDPDKFLNIREVMQAQAPGTAVYCCGPHSLMDAVRKEGAAFRQLSLHFEAFGSAPALADAAVQNEPFRIVCKESGQELDVPADKSILDVLLEAGLDVDHSCKEGYCGTCLTRWTEGAPIHRDSCLSEKEREKYMAVCSARAARGQTIVLDI